MWAVGLALEFGVKLAGHEEGVTLELNQFDQRVDRGETAEEEISLFLEELAIFVVKDVAIAMALGYLLLSVNGAGFGAALEFAVAGAQVYVSTLFV